MVYVHHIGDTLIVNMLTLIRNNSRGFTIVELLIVIVVIAILAAISIVAYQGIQNRAYNSAVVSSVNGYVKLLKMYKADHGAYPAIENDHFSDTICLGVISDFDETGVYQSGECTKFESGPVYKISNQFNDTLAKYGSLASGKAPEIKIDGHATVRGFLYFNGITAGLGVDHAVIIYYPKKGGNSCPIGDFISGDLQGLPDNDTCTVILE